MVHALVFHRFSIRNACALALALAALRLNSQEVTVGVGAMQSPDSHQTSYSWHIDYRRPIIPRLSWSASWINEGHVQGHHRDGVAAQLWAESPWPRTPFQLTAGLGAYHFFDTQQQPDGDSQIEHGWSPIGSVALTYYPAGRIFWRLTANTIMPPDGITVNTLTVAVGYQLGKTTFSLRSNSDEPVAEHRSELSSQNSITVFAGKTVVNASVGDQGLALSVEYRRRLTRHSEWTASVLDEGDAGVLRRHGVASQYWLVESWRRDRLSIGIGAGLYYSFERARGPQREKSQQLMGLISPTVAFRFADDWVARTIWHRVITDYHRDCDVFLLGVGREW